MQIASYIIPIVTIPYVSRVLGVELFGRASYALNIVAYLTVLINYGFDYSATQIIAINRDNKILLNNLFFSIIRYRIYLLILSFVIMLCLYFTFSKVNQDPMLYVYASLINVGIAILPNWFYQGMETMGKVALINFSIKLFGALLTFMLIKQSSDYKLYVFVLSLTYVAGGLWALSDSIKRFDIRQPEVRDKSYGRQALRRGFPIFINLLFCTVYALLGLTFVGIYRLDHEVGIYSGAFRLIMAVNSVVSASLAFTLFPSISRRFDESQKEGWNYFKKLLFIACAGSAAVSILVYLFSPFVVHLFLGARFEDSIHIVQQMSLLPFLTTTAGMVTIQGIFGMQLQKYALFIGLTACVSGLLFNFWLVLPYGAEGAVWAWCLSCVVEILLSTSFLLIHRPRRKQSSPNAP